MTIRDTLNSLLHPAQVTRGRIAVALIAAIAADGLQILLQAIPFAPQVIDVIAAVIVTMAIGFHVLLLPTFVIELLPFVDDLPTWTACVLAVIALRSREERLASAGVSPVITATPSPEVSNHFPESSPPR